MIDWAYAFIDRPSATFDAGATFWTGITGTSLSDRRGAYGEFATLVPAAGDPCLKIQGVAGTGGAHIDLVTTDPGMLADTAAGLGAEVVAPHSDWSVMRSPGGQLFCVTPLDGESVRPGVVTGPGGVISRVDQICLDVPPAAFAGEVAFWSELTGWTARAGLRPEFHIVRPDADRPIRILLQRLDGDRPASAHIDIACGDIPAVRAWHESLGATHVTDGPHWAVMRDPAGGVYCLTARDPHTGALPA